MAQRLTDDKVFQWVKYNLLSDRHIWEDNIKVDLKDTARDVADWIDSTRERFDDHLVRTITRFLDFNVLCSSKNTIVE